MHKYINTLVKMFKSLYDMMHACRLHTSYHVSCFFCCFFECLHMTTSAMIKNPKLRTIITSTGTMNAIMKLLNGLSQHLYAQQSKVEFNNNSLLDFEVHNLHNMSHCSSIPIAVIQAMDSKAQRNTNNHIQQRSTFLKKINIEYMPIL